MTDLEHEVETAAASGRGREAWVDVLGRAGRAWTQMRGVPAVPTLDWSDRVAGVMSLALGGACVLVVVGDVAASGVVERIQQVGVSEGAGSVPRGAGELRWRAASAEGRAWWAGRGRGGGVEVWSAPVATSGFGVEEAWAMMGVAWVTVASAAVGGEDGARRLLVQAGRTNGRLSEAETALLESLMPGVASAARVAIGLGVRTSADWVSQREREVLDMLVEGLTVPEIATRLSRSPHTVHDHVKSLHRKLGARSRGELVAAALGHSLDGPARG